MTTPTLLIVDDEKATREGLRAALEDRFDVYIAEDAARAMELLEKEHFNVLLTDLRMPKEDGLQLIKRAKSLPKPPVCILMTAFGSEDIAAQAIKLGADDYIPKARLNFDELEHRILKTLKLQTLESENHELHERLEQKFGLENIVGDSKPMHEIFETFRQVAPTRRTVLITGESGTGKELIAKAIHQLSPRARAPLIAFHCAGLPASLLESELFGHEKGAFTGAHERRLGRVESANGGSLFLDEIGEIDATTQVKLLRFLGERTFERIGSSKTQMSDVRIICATNKNLEDRVRRGSFREDLYYRLAVVPIHLPPLRERVSDIPLLANFFLKQFAEEHAREVKSFSTDAMDLMLRHRWQGNVRELNTAVQHAVVMARGEAMLPKDLPAALRLPAAEITARETSDKFSAGQLTVKEAEKQLVIHALQECDGNRTKAAEKLGMSRRTLHRKLHEYHLESY